MSDVTVAPVANETTGADSAVVAGSTNPTFRELRDPDSFKQWVKWEDVPEDAPSELEPEAQAEPEAEGSAERDEKGRFVAKEKAEPEEAVPETEVEAPKLPFAVLDKDGNDVSLSIHDAKVSMKANGKEVLLPIADVVRKAQSEEGVQRAYRQERQEKEALAQQVTSQDELIAQLRQTALNLVRNDEYRESLRLELEQYDSPEARAERAEQQLAAERARIEQEKQQSQHQSQAATFAQQHVAPVMEEVLTQYVGDGLVSEYELLGRFHADTAPILVNGVIPPERFGELAEYLAGPFREFAASLHAERLGQRTQQEERKAMAEREAQVKAQKLKNETAAVVKPVGNVPDMRSESRPKSDSVKDRHAHVMESVWGVK